MAIQVPNRGIKNEVPSGESCMHHWLPTPSCPSAPLMLRETICQWEGENLKSPTHMARESARWSAMHTDYITSPMRRRRMPSNF